MKRLALKAFAALLTAVVLLYGAVVGYMYVRQTALLYPGAGVPYSVDYSGLNVERLSLATADGETLEARFMPPAAGKPVVLFFHGNGGDAQGVLWRYRALKAAGYGMLAPSYRGYGESSGSPGEAGLFEDARTAYQWLIKQGYAAEDIVIHGHSLGTGVAVWLSTEVPSRALVLEAPFTAAVDVAAQSYPWLPVPLLMRDRYESRARIGRIKAPLLVVHGTDDETIPFAMGRALFDAAPEPKQFVAIEGGRHSTLSQQGLYTHLIAFTGR